MNTDGTTLQQKKINGVVIDDIVISVGEQVDGTSDSIIDHVSKELQKLREMARDLGLPNSESINWTLYHVQHLTLLEARKNSISWLKNVKK